MLDGLLCPLEREDMCDEFPELGHFATRDQSDGTGPGVLVAEDEPDVDLCRGQLHERDLNVTLADTCDDHTTSWTGGVSTHGNGRLDTGALDSNGWVDFTGWARATYSSGNLGEELDDLSCRLLRSEGQVDLVRLDLRAELLGKGQTLLLQVSNDNGVGTCGSCAKQLDYTNRASSDDECGRSKLDGSTLCSSKTDAQRLQQSDFWVGHAVGDLVEPTSWVHVVSGQRTVHGRHRVEVDGWAKVVVSGSAVVAGHLTAGYSWLDGYLVSDLDVLDTFANSDDDTTTLVTEGGLVCNLPCSQSSVLPEVNIRATHTRGAERFHKKRADVKENRKQAHEDEQRGEEGKMDE